ncbi:DUF2007 domain-containing protein [Marinobacter caseinilyticus]|uniref:putative signal transducing protein n=1 Tax=Marinobacter caseinilyticus TaxID=2692195 RepID=UPI00140BD297|nr:DUF2007 domain-containing protein [Marinobacter caseinilyticus]
MTWVTIGHYSLPFEAHLDRSRLESEGITAIIADEHTINMQWMLSDALGGVRLRVQDDQLYKARKILEEDRSGLLESLPSQAPEVMDSESQQGDDGLHLSSLTSKRRKRGFFATLLALFIGT